MAAHAELAAWVGSRLARGEDGLPVAGRFEVRLARAIVVVASVWFGLAAAWELFGPLLAGHYAASASEGIIAENMLRWKIAGPVWEYTATRPTPAQYYCHHPWGIFWVTAGFLELFGRFDFVCRLPAVLLSAATPPLLYLLGRALWRPLAGALAAAGFVVLPIALAFASFNALEVPVIAWSLLGLWAYVRHAQTQRRRYLVACLVGFGMALHADWPAFVLVAEVLALGLWRGILARRGAYGPIPARPHARLWALLAATAVATALLYVYLFSKAGKLDDFLGSYGMRAAGNQQSLADVLAGRRYWIELTFTPLAILTGKIAAVVCLVRALVRRDEHELLPLAVLAVALFQYLVFKQGADIHVYWPHYFAPFFALGLGAVADTLLASVGRATRVLAARRARRVPTAAPAAALEPRRALVAIAVLALFVCAFVLRDGLPALVYARQTGGRFNEKGALIQSDGDKVAFLRWLAERIPRDADVSLHEGMIPNWSLVWALGGRVVSPTGALPQKAGTRVYLADTRFLYDSAQAAIAKGAHVTAVGPFWQVTEGEPLAPLEAYAFVEREPGPLEWYFVSGTEPVRTIVPSPWLTWELRDHFGQPAEPPEGEPDDLDELRIAHNLALARGEDTSALLARVTAAFGAPTARFDDGTELLGVRFEPGARDLLTLLVRAAAPPVSDVQLFVRSRVVARATLSTTMADPSVREVGLPLPIAPQRWKAGYLYFDRVPIRKRPGTERFEAYFKLRSGKGKAPVPVDGGTSVVVLELD
ncbi:MAG: glycosyltransferase family 39 protein [Myxococcales bacterium]|nr:glycosyltransferase family 39 protein [Myxococcales bacterium]